MKATASRKLLLLCIRRVQDKPIQFKISQLLIAYKKVREVNNYSIIKPLLLLQQPNYLLELFSSKYTRIFE